MEIIEPKKSAEVNSNKKLSIVFNQLNGIVLELRKKELPKNIVHAINKEIETLNSTTVLGKDLKKQIKKTQCSITKLLEKELKIVTKNHYRNTWMAIGIAAFGIPLGAAFGVAIGNVAFLGIGLPIGMAIGIAVGTAMDKKAFEEGRQLKTEINA